MIYFTYQTCMRLEKMGLECTSEVYYDKELELFTPAFPETNSYVLCPAYTFEDLCNRENAIALFDRAWMTKVGNLFVCKMYGKDVEELLLHHLNERTEHENN